MNDWLMIQTLSTYTSGMIIVLILEKKNVNRISLIIWIDIKQAIE
jgi:hypothetical protein